MRKKKFFLEKSQLREGALVKIPPSKSESNRYLILNALSDYRSSIKNLSDSEDTKVLSEGLKSKMKVVHLGNAGTAMRFLTAYFALTNQKRILKGSKRMHERPIRELVRVLRELGAGIKYLGKKGYPPLEIQGFKYSGKKTVVIDGSVSSQFVSAIMMVGPLIPVSLNIMLKGKVVSLPYILLTAKLMKEFGIVAKFKKNHIIIPNGKYDSRNVQVDGDWSAASYWYSLFRLSENNKMTLRGLSDCPKQGDASIMSLMKRLGVTTRPISNGFELTRGKIKTIQSFQLLENPDLAQTLIALCAFLRVKAKFRGLETLSIKETDRIRAMKTELLKFGAKFIYKGNGIYELSYKDSEISDSVTIETYGDHRMAMAFSPACLLTSLSINDPEVVSKSYPDFWKSLQKCLSQV